MSPHDHHDDHDHHHDHAGHGAAHGGHHHHHATPGGKRYGVALALNLAIVAIETGGGLLGHSTALLADAAHNLSDVLGLALAGGATWLATRPAGGQRTYGFGKATVLAALVNGVVLMFVSGALAVEALHRLTQPTPVATGLVAATAAVGVMLNAATALLFARDHGSDVNVRGVFLHMAADAAISVGVIVAAGLIALTGLNWLDPVISLVIVAVIAAGTWGLLREAADLALDAAPQTADLAGIQRFLQQSEGVTEVHDLHVWALSTTETALTAHLVRPNRDHEDIFRGELAEALERRFGVRHATLQIEPARSEHCPVC